jgi:hypothetical protein
MVLHYIVLSSMSAAIVCTRYLCLRLGNGSKELRVFRGLAPLTSPHKLMVETIVILYTTQW